jgi:tRNA(Ile)-lysidine synthase
MKINVQPGKYIVAVSGGVDSVVLLDVLNKQNDLELVVAHFDHGIRDDSADDRVFVEDLAKKYNLRYEYAEGELGANASEAIAREARYTFLKSIAKKYQADAVITAHHQDDLLETIIINLLRGTGRKGITSLGETNELKRPLLQVTKQEILAYAKDNNLQWHEDSTNADEKYLRNWVRGKLMPKLTTKERTQLLTTHQQLSEKNIVIDALLNSFMTIDKQTLSRKELLKLDNAVAKEVVASWLRANELKNFDQKTLERIVIGAKTLEVGKIIPVIGSSKIEVQREKLFLKR